MSKYLLLLLSALLISPWMMAGDKKKNKTADASEIHWMNLDEVQVAMKKAPKKVLMDVYTDWCGWCKVMDKKTFSDANVIKYVNENFYAVKVNAEQQDSIRFMGKWYNYAPEKRANDFAIELLRGQMSYPTTVILEENFQNPQPIPGYLDVPTIEKILKYLGENHYKTEKFEEFSATFKPSWTAASPVEESDFRGGH